MTSLSASFAFQEQSGWCGVAVCAMILSGAGISKSQTEIANDIYLPWWGTTHDTLLAYLSQYFTNLDYKEDGLLEDIMFHLNNNHALVINWFDDLDPHDEEGGHYSIILNYDKEQKKLTLADPSNARKGIWEMNEEEFMKRWYDYIDMNKTIKSSHWLLWVDMTL